jgi:formyl-CoA transferase
MGALSDIRVVEFAQALAVPYCGTVLADMGADVVKVEPPRGDTYRLQTPTPVKGEGRDFAICNRGKRSVCLDLTHADASGVIDSLVSRADVVLVSMKHSDVVRYGLTYERLHAVKSELVYLQNTPYGPAGPMGDDGGYDNVAMGMSGLTALMANSDGTTPHWVRPALADVVTGMVSSLAVVTAIRHRDRTGEGQQVRTSLLHTALGMISNMVYRFEDLDGGHMDAFADVLSGVRSSGGGFDDQQQAYIDHFGGRPPGNIYFRHYRTSDGFLSVGCLSPRLNERFREATGLVDPRRERLYERHSVEERTAQDLLVAEAEELFASRTTADWLEHLRSHGVPAGRVNFPHEIFDDPQANANGYIATLEHRHHGEYRVATTPVQMDRTPLVPGASPPSIGEHTDEVLAEVGVSEPDVRRLRDAGVVGRWSPAPSSD